MTAKTKPPLSKQHDLGRIQRHPRWETTVHPAGTAKFHNDKYICEHFNIYVFNYRAAGNLYGAPGTKFIQEPGTSFIEEAYEEEAEVKSMSAEKTDVI
jgi:hypothetical protein